MKISELCSQIIRQLFMLRTMIVKSTIPLGMQTEIPLYGFIFSEKGEETEANNLT